jgi:hypothetical protein
MYRVRPVSGPCTYTRLYRDVNGQTLTAIAAGQLPAHLLDDVQIKTRYAIYVIDRSDNMVKILDGPTVLFRSFSHHAEATGRNPEDVQKGSDFAVKKNGSGLSTRYDVSTISITPLTDEEQATVGMIDKDRLFTKIFQAHTPEQITERLKLDEI